MRVVAAAAITVAPRLPVAVVYTADIPLWELGRPRETAVFAREGRGEGVSGLGCKSANSPMGRNVVYIQGI